MAKTIPQLTDATTVNAADELIVQQGGITKRATLAELQAAATTQSATGWHFAQNGARINRLNDRLFVGAATTNDGAFPNSSKDWLSTYTTTLFKYLTVGQVATGQTTSGSPVVTFSAGGITPVAGKPFFANQAIPLGTTILSVDSATQVTLSQNAIATTTDNTFYSESTSVVQGLGVSATLSSMIQNGSACAGIFAAQTSGFTNAGTNGIGLASYAVNNGASASFPIYAGYFEAHRLSGTYGAIGVEINVLSTNFAETQSTSYRQSGTVALQLGCGCGLTTDHPNGSQKNCGAAIQVVANPLPFKSGLVFLGNAIEGTDGSTGSTGTAIAISMGRRQHLAWYEPVSNTRAASITSTQNQSGKRVTQVFENDGVSWLGNNNGVIAQILHQANGVNYFSLHNGAAGSAARILAAGEDANIDARIDPKGTGVIRYGTHAAVTTETLSGFITIKDAAGNTRKLAVVS
jgi:hypothetical protein